MPTLKEYILTLRTYNPGITDKTITIYLLKLGKRIEDIQLAFREVNPVNLNSLDRTPSAPIVPTVSNTNNVIQTTEIEVMPAELSSQSIAPAAQTVQNNKVVHTMQKVQTVQTAQTVQATQTAQTEIHHQSFDHLIRLQDMIKDLDAQGGEKKDLIIEPAINENNQSFAGLEPKNQPGSSMQRKKFSYEELFGSTPTSTPALVVETVHDTGSAPKKDPTVSYVGGSIIAGQGSGAFAFNASPTLNIRAGENHMTDQMTEQIKERTEEKPLVTSILQAGVGVQAGVNRSISGMVSTASTGIPKATKLMSSMQMAQSAMDQVVDTKINIQTVPHKKGIVKKIVLFIIVIAIVLGGLFGYTRYVHEVYLFVKAPYTVDTFITQLGTHLASIQTAEYEVALNLSTATPSENDEVFTQPIKSVSLPLGSKIALGAEGTYQKDTSSRDNIFSIKGSYVDSGMTLDIDIDSVTNDGVLYIKINSLPTFLLDFSQIQGKWIAVTPEDIETLFGREIPLTDTSTSTEKTMIEALEKVVASGAFSVISPPNKIITSEQKAQYVYEVAVRFDKLSTLLQQISIGEGITTLEQVSPEMREYIDYLNRHTKVFITVDSKGNLVEINMQSDVTTAIATDSQKVKTSSVLSIKTKNLNKSIKVASPEKIDMNSIDAYALITGQNKEDILFERQLSRVLQADQEIMNYIDSNEKTPASLKEIIEKSKISVKDIFTNPVGEFGYIGTADGGYELTYHMKLPQVPSSYYKLLDDLTIGPDATSNARTGSVEKYNTGINTTNKKPTLTLRFVEGKNTATTDVLSKEALATLGKDKDRDGVSDTLEAYLGLNSAKADTDGDGASDMAELRQGTNPKGTGSWSEAYGPKREDDMFKGDIE